MPVAPYHYVVGDIHGCLDELLALEAKVKKHAAKADTSPMIVSVGDLVDRGPNTAGVLQHLREGVASGTHAVVLGNHEQMLMEILQTYAPGGVEDAGVTLPSVLRDFRKNHADTKSSSRFLSLDDYLQFRRLLWVAEGGGATLQSFGCPIDKPKKWRIPPEDLRFLAALPLVWENDAMIVTHALADSDSLDAARRYQGDRQSHMSMGQIMSVLWERHLPKQRLDKKRWHVSGHTVTKRVTVRKNIACVQVDSGCVFGRRLSVWCLETEEALSVKGRKT